MIENNLSPAANHRKPEFYWDVLLRSLVMLVIFNLIFAILEPIPAMGRISAYNLVFPGRLRLPYGENPSRDYSMSLSSLEAMFASHEMTGITKSATEYRVVFIGDSSIWGWLLSPTQTLTAYLNTKTIELSDGRIVRAYNLGYPVMSLAKDLLILEEALTYEPEMIVWPLTLESFPEDKQFSHPLLQQNPTKVWELDETYSLGLDKQTYQHTNTPFWKQTIIGSRRSLADLLRLQLYGVMWAATGIDHEIPSTYTPRQEDLPADTSFHDLSGPTMSNGDLAFELLFTGHRMAGQVPVLLVNEPMFISKGENSHIRYNFFYPRWAYDEYRRLLLSESQENGWYYLDLWDAIESNQFTNSAIHMTPKGTQQFAELLVEYILTIAETNAQVQSK